MTMDESVKEKQQVILQAGHTVSELLKDSGNCRQINNQELSLRPLSDSLLSERQKLRHVLNWAHSFLSSGSEIHREFCRADSLMLVSKEQRDIEKKTSTWKHSSAAENHHFVSCGAGGSEVFWGEVGGREETVWHREPSNYENTEFNKLLCGNKSFMDEPCIPLSFTPGADVITLIKFRETPKKMNNIKLQDANDEQTCRRSNPFESNQRQSSNFSDGNTSQTPAVESETSLCKKITSCCSNACHKRSRLFGTATNLKLSNKTAEFQSKRDRSAQRMEPSKVKVNNKVQAKKDVVWMCKRKGKVNKEKDLISASVINAKNKKSNSEPELAKESMEKTSVFKSHSHLKLSPSLTVYEQYQLCVDHLHHLRLRQSQHVDLGCFIESPAKGKRTSKEMAAPVETPAPPTSGIQSNSSTKDPEIKKLFDKKTAVEITKERSLTGASTNKAKLKYNRNRSKLTEQRRSKQCDTSTVRKTPAAICAESGRVCQRKTFTSNKHSHFDSKKYRELIKGTAGGITPADDGPTIEKGASIKPDTGTEYAVKCKTRATHYCPDCSFQPEV